MMLAFGLSLQKEFCRIFAGRGKFPPAFALIVLSFLAVYPAAASESVRDRTAMLHVRQEKEVRDGILVARPLAVDEHIAFFLRTHHIENLADYCAWLEKNIAYKKKSSASRWPTPYATLRQREGDCKNFAALNAAVLHVLGFEPRIVVFFIPGRGHAVCAFKVGGCYWWFDNAVLKKTSATSLPEFVRHMERRYKLFFSREIKGG